MCIVQPHKAEALTEGSWYLTVDTLDDAGWVGGEHALNMVLRPLLKYCYCFYCVTLGMPHALSVLSV